MTPTSLAGAYGSFAPGGGIGLYGTPIAFRRLAALVRQTSGKAVMLDPAPAGVLEEAQVSGIACTDVPGQPVDVRRRDGRVEVTGGAVARDMLAETLENLADAEDRLDDVIPPHVDLEYFEGHGFLAPTSMWMTVLLTRDPLG